MSKKILSVVLALVLMLTIAAPAFALGFEDPKAETPYTQAWALSEPVDKGDGTWTVSVSLTANYNAMSFAFEISNTDNKNVVLKSVTKGAGIPADWNAKIAFSNTTGKISISPNTDADDFGVAALDCSAGKEIAVLTYTVAEGKSAQIAIVNNPKTETNPGGTLVAARSSNNNVVTDGDNPIVGQTVLSVGETRTLGSAAAEPADLALTETGASAGVLIDTHKTFGGAYAGVVFGIKQINNATFMNTTVFTTNLKATNGGSLKFTRKDGKTSGGYGTCSTIEVLNSDGTSTGKVYVFVLFGDVDGNALINTADATEAKKASKNKVVYADSTVQRMAANSQTATVAVMNNNVLTAEVTAIKNNSKTPLDQAALAASQYALNGT